MNGSPPDPDTRLPAGARAVMGEAAVVIAIGLLVGLLANLVSPRGLQLGRDYFLAASLPVSSIAGGPAPPGPAPEATNSVLVRLRQRGLQPLADAEVLALFRDPKRTSELIVFVDARNDSLYQAGHVPGAWQLDYYHPEAYLPAVLPACTAAEQVVVYCTGGECEDSELAALLLAEAGVPRARIFIYPGGFAAWSAAALPLETGARGSGVLRGGTP